MCIVRMSQIKPAKKEAEKDKKDNGQGDRPITQLHWTSVLSCAKHIRKQQNFKNQTAKRYKKSNNW